jgi:5-(carboxyamino)imidazole ribonucleotide mutase
MQEPVVGIIMGSKSDLDIMEGVAKVLDEFGISNELRVLSAHRTPDETSEYVKGASGRGLKIIVAGAGGSAHLAGVTAAQTNLPVISVPIKREGHGDEALLSNVAMPPGIPLATMPANGSKNAALLAARILALSDNILAKKYEDFVQKQHDAVLESDASIQS